MVLVWIIEIRNQRLKVDGCLGQEKIILFAVVEQQVAHRNFLCFLLEYILRIVRNHKSESMSADNKKTE